MRGAEKQGKMAVEFAIVVNVEFIPAGCERGPVKPIYFKILKAGVVGGVFGWPNLDKPTMPGGEGLAQPRGWRRVRSSERHDPAFG